MEDGIRMETRRSPRESRESLRQVGRALCDFVTL
jgi:hypothetical protein